MRTQTTSTKCKHPPSAPLTFRNSIQVKKIVQNTQGTDCREMFRFCTSAPFRRNGCNRVKCGHLSAGGSHPPTDSTKKLKFGKAVSRPNLYALTLSVPRTTKLRKKCSVCCFRRRQVVHLYVEAAKTNHYTLSRRPTSEQKKKALPPHTPFNKSCAANRAFFALIIQELRASA